uniref:CUE domain-containing protein n=1 Tax=Romanomermis culicivorax TaxID=13658 RepID=A0A915IPE4_ROMCU
MLKVFHDQGAHQSLAALCYLTRFIMKSSIQKRTNSPVNISDDDDDFNLDPYSDSDKIFDEPVAKKVKADFGDHASILYEMLDASSEEIENAITLDENIDEAALYILNGGNNRSIANESAPNHHACITTEDHIRTMKAKYNYSDQIFVKISRHKKAQWIIMLQKQMPVCDSTAITRY